MTRTHVASASELDPGERRFVEVDGQELCVLNHEGEFFCIENRCPHRSGEVARGEILPEITLEERGTGHSPREVFAEDAVITCPWHGWEFYLDTGRHPGDPRPEFTLQTFDVIEEDGELYVDP